MTVAELIKKLSHADQDMQIMLPGYEGGFCDIGDIATEKVALNVNTKHYYGPHESVPNHLPGIYTYVMRGKR